MHTHAHTCTHTHTHTHTALSAGQVHGGCQHSNGHVCRVHRGRRAQPRGKPGSSQQLQGVSLAAGVWVPACATDSDVRLLLSAPTRAHVPPAALDHAARHTRCTPTSRPMSHPTSHPKGGPREAGGELGAGRGGARDLQRWLLHHCVARVHPGRSAALRAARQDLLHEPVGALHHAGVGVGVCVCVGGGGLPHAWGLVCWRLVSTGWGQVRLCVAVACCVKW
jgi:hypothetical protein